MEIRSVTVEAFFAHADTAALLTEYAAECANSELPPPNPDRSMYELLERAGALHVLAASSGERMHGFLVLLLSPNPHYSVLLAVSESLFVASEHRGSGAGLALIRAARQLASDRGATGFYISAPAAGRLASVLPGLGAQHTNDVFFWRLAA